MKIEQHKDFNIGILGLGRTGIATFKALLNNCSELVCYDDNKDNCSTFAKEHSDSYIADYTDPRWYELDKIVISPGIPHDHRIFEIAKKHSITITSDIELFLQNNPDSDFVMITGTNGKSTVTALVGHILAYNQAEYIVGGNIGIPVFDLPQNAKGYILEISSFQLDLLGNIHPRISALLNITPDHLDRHGTIEEYIRVKKKILAHDHLKIIGIDNHVTREIYSHIKEHEPSKVIGISAKEENTDVVTCSGTEIIDNFFDAESYIYKNINSLVGAHNRENIAAAFAICRGLGILPADIISGLVTFPGLPHRLQFVKQIGNIAFYNDSKATNSAACRTSLAAMDNIYWLVGGKYKEQKFELGPEITKVRKAYIYGHDAEIFANYLDGKLEYVIYDNLEASLKAAYRDAKDASTKSNDSYNILLAPACTSFDQFKNFEERGNKFIEITNTLR